MDKKRIVVTGIGTVNSVANNVQETWKGILDGKSGIKTLIGLGEDLSNYPCKVGGEVKNFDLSHFLKDRYLSKGKKLDRFTQFGLAAAKEAVESASLNFSKNPHRVGITISSGVGGMEACYKNSKKLFERGPRAVSPFFVSSMISNTISGFLSMMHGLTGPSFSVQTACATGNYSISFAVWMIQLGLIDVALVGGAESTIDPITISAFSKMRALSTKYNDQPKIASRPYDKDRDGFVIANGAGVLVLEEYEHAKKRNANIICEIASVALNSDAWDLVSPHPDGKGVEACIRSALKDAKINPSEIDYINTHGTSTPLGDIAEIKAMAKILGKNQENTHISSTKSMTGHSLGAAAGIEAIFAALAIKNNEIPAGINIDNFDSEIPLKEKMFPKETIEKDINIAISNSFGFGGHNSCLILKKI